MPKRALVVAALMLVLSGTSGCIGTIIGQTADAAIEVGKIPFKVGAAVVDVATGDDDKDAEKDKK